MTRHPFLILPVAAALALAGCGGDDDAATTTSAPATTAPAAGSADVNVSSNDELGEYLVDGDGMTLYLFEQDQGTTTACSGACADNWPPIVSSGGSPTGGEGVSAADLSVADGIVANQITYHGHLLYYFAGDEAAGDTNGVGLPAWYPVDPAGNAIGDE